MRQETGHLAGLHHEAAEAWEWPQSCLEMVQRCTDLIDQLQRERGLADLLPMRRGMLLQMRQVLAQEQACAVTGSGHDTQNGKPA